MTPRTRSGGAAPPSSIVYKSTPTLRQTQFPARRRRVRTYGKRSRRSLGGEDEEEDEEGSSAHPTPNLKQKTLTQYEFASSSLNPESVVELSDASDVEELEKAEDAGDAEKENNVPKGTKRRRSATAARAPLHPILDLEEGGEEEGEKEEEELRVPDTEAEEEEDEEEGDEGPIVRGRRRVGFTSTAKAKRRRTLGEEHRMSTMKESRASRRRTLGDSPIAGPSKSRYHTQTLTQFIGRKTSFVVADSDDEELASPENDGFLEWLGAEEDEPQSPSLGTQASKRGGKAAAAAAAAASPTPVVWEDHHSPSPRRNVRRPRPATTTQAGGEQSREESVVPQTPIKSIRFDLPPSAQHMITSPSPTRMAAIYGAPNADASPSSQRQRKQKKQKHSPLKPLAELMGQPRQRRVSSSSSATKKPELVIEDSYATEGGWSSVGGTQARLGTPSQTQTEVFSTPAEEMTSQQPPAAGTASASASKKKGKEAAPAPPHTQSQDGQAEEQQFYGALSQVVQDSAAASQQPVPAAPKKAAQPAEEEGAAATVSEEREIPDSDDEDVGFGAESDDAGDEAEESRFAAGAETQLLMDQLQSSVRKWSGVPRAGHASSSSVASPHPPRTSSPVPSPASAATPASAPPSSSLKPLPTTKTKPKQQQPPPPSRPAAIVAHDIPVTHSPGSTPLRKPLHRPQEPLDTQGLPLVESQRVALATLQGFTPASARTDILLPLSDLTLANLLSGHQDAVILPFKIPAQVVRFWLLHDGVLRYLACVAGDHDHDHDPKQENGCGGHGTWTYRVGQVYELNNPMQEEDMRAEDWIHGRVNRYVYFPPAVVSQLLWNLRHAVFPDPADDEAAAATTPARHTLTSSSPLRRSSRLSTPGRTRIGHPMSSPSPLQHARPPASTMPAPPPPARPSGAGARKHHTQQALMQPPSQSFVRPSQATTASQASTVVDIPSSLAKTTTAAPAVIPRAGDESSESLVFDDHGGSSIPMPYSSGAYSGLANLEASQLLTKSQILPDSLIQDEEHAPPDEIWDSEEE
ncbi:hypothetical protein LEL_09487 [Akanthomyces lecanii RCEF 1005]|uniref:Uncharacterized protein n=1 Tax=Akanthomyces lecanii RCEF 1005 TaxID=1081108 RepID=A0A168C3T0_CORDF|nr:hypothetical protein LEL_09487 [Akanthomyces lecanii RCEF 1005]